MKTRLVKEALKVNLSRTLVTHAGNPTQEAEIRRIKVQSQPRQIVH
jgi:hypothetical protein